MFFSSILYKGVSDILKTGVQTYFFKIVQNKKYVWIRNFSRTPFCVHSEKEVKRIEI